MNKGQIILLMAFCAIGLAAFVASENNAPGKTGREMCNGITAAKISEAMETGRKIGLFPGRVGEITEVDERVWAEFPHDMKVASALLVYCSLGSGTTNLLLRGWRDGETKASLVNGNYSD